MRQLLMFLEQENNSNLHAKQKQLLKKGVAKQSRIKRIIRHLRWLASTRADISLQPSGLVRSKTDIKLQLSILVRPKTDIKLKVNWIGKVIQGLIQLQIYMQIFLNCH